MHRLRTESSSWPTIRPPAWCSSTSRPARASRSRTRPWWTPPGPSARWSATAHRSTPARCWQFAGDPRALRVRGALAVALDSVGLAGAALDATVGYAAERHQFGRPIGSFQAVKHACANVAVELTISRRLVVDAVEQVVAGAPDADVAVSMAKAHAAETAVAATGTALQLHGGIGYTWEHGLHVLLKRAALNRSLFGSPSAHPRGWRGATADPPRLGSPPSDVRPVGERLSSRAAARAGTHVPPDRAIGGRIGSGGGTGSGGETGSGGGRFPRPRRWAADARPEAGIAVMMRRDV